MRSRPIAAVVDLTVSAKECGCFVPPRWLCRGIDAVGFPQRLVHFTGDPELCCSNLCRRTEAIIPFLGRLPAIVLSSAAGLWKSFRAQAERDSGMIPNSDPG